VLSDSIGTVKYL